MAFIKKQIFIFIQIGLILLVSASATAAAQLSPGVFATGYVDSEHNLWLCGSNSTSTTLSYLDGFELTSTPKVAMKDVADVEIGFDRAAVIKTDGTLWMWGNNSFGALGIGSYAQDSNNSYVNKPTQVLTDVKKVVIGYCHTLALKNDGTVWAWGDGKNGAIGNGKILSRVTALSRGVDPEYLSVSPEQVKLFDTATDIAAGFDSSMAVTKDGKAYIWGNISVLPQLRDKLGYYVAQPQFFEDNVKKVVLDQSALTFGAAILNNGALQTFGDNCKGMIGNGNTSDKENPTIVIQSGVKDVKIGTSHVVALKDDGTVYTWGNGNSGQLGDGITSDDYFNPHVVTKPQQVASDVKEIGASSGTTTGIIKTNGQVLICGDNSDGQCGTGNTNSIPTFTELKVSPATTPDEPSKPEEPTVKNFTVSVTVSPVGAGTVTGAGSYKENSSATLSATANSGYRFVNWTENGNQIGTNASLSFTVTNNRNIQANFKKINTEPDNPSQPSQPEQSTMVIYRMYNPVSLEHLYTSDRNEYDTLPGSSDWEQEGTAWNSPTSGEPVYRLYCSVTGAHLYTKDQNEINTLKASGIWTVDNNDQPIMYSGGNKDIYRLYNEGVKMHLLTTDFNEYNTLGQNGWNQEGVALKAVS